MKMRPIHFKGFFEEQTDQIGEQLQVLAPESEMEKNLLCWAILQQPETVGDDQSRQEYVFHYELGEMLEEGIFRLRVSCRDASGREHGAEIAAALVVTVGTLNEGRPFTFSPFWFISKRMHYRPMDEEGREGYHRPAFGHLRFGGMDNLPHRRLFGATV